MFNALCSSKPQTILPQNVSQAPLLSILLVQVSLELVYFVFKCQPINFGPR